MKTAALGLLFACPLLAYGPGMLNIETPSPFLRQGSIEFRLNHRFYGAALKDQPFETFMGMGSGANVAVDLGWFPVQGLELRAGHTRLRTEYRLEGLWSAGLNRFQGLFSLGYSSTKAVANQDRKGGLNLLGSLALPVVDNRVTAFVNYSYDGVSERHGPGFGLSVQVGERTALIGEFFPLVDRDDSDPTLLPDHPFSFGIRRNTWGHQFMICLGNSTGIGPRGQLNGAPDNDLSIGFTVKRLF